MMTYIYKEKKEEEEEAEEAEESYEDESFKPIPCHPR